MAFRAVSCGYCRPLGTSAGTMFISESQMCFSTCSDRVLASGQPCAALRQVSGPCCVTSFPPQSEWPHRGTVWSRARRHSVSKRTSSTKKKVHRKRKSEEDFDRNPSFDEQGKLRHRRRRRKLDRLHQEKHEGGRTQADEMQHQQLGGHPGGTTIETRTDHRRPRQERMDTNFPGLIPALSAQ